MPKYFGDTSVLCYVYTVNLVGCDKRIYSTSLVRNSFSSFQVTDFSQACPRQQSDRKVTNHSVYTRSLFRA